MIIIYLVKERKVLVPASFRKLVRLILRGSHRNPSFVFARIKSCAHDLYNSV